MFVYAIIYHTTRVVSYLSDFKTVKKDEIKVLKIEDEVQHSLELHPILLR